MIRYRERVDGRIRQRVIYLGNDESLAEQARELIQRWRREAMSPEDLRRAELLRLHKITIACLDISRRAKQRLLRQAKQTLGDRLAELAFVMSLRPDNPALWRTGRPGRPSGSGLW